MFWRVSAISRPGASVRRPWPAADCRETPRRLTQLHDDPVPRNPPTASMKRAVTPRRDVPCWSLAIFVLNISAGQVWQRSPAAQRGFRSKSAGRALFAGLGGAP
jgi:hypothetical protein